MAPNPESTRRSLIAAAESLFAERGIEGTSLREINSAAGQRNSTALQYHFGDRAGLLQAVMRKHQAVVDEQRHAMLDAYEADERDDVRGLAAALVRPMSAKLRDTDGGRAFLRIYAQIMTNPDFSYDPVRLERSRDSLARWRRMVLPHLSEMAAGRLHVRFAAIRVLATELARRAAGSTRRDDELFTSYLTDLITAILCTPVSAETESLLEVTHSG